MKAVVTVVIPTAAFILFHMIADNTAVAQAPNCGNMPCIAVLSNLSENCAPDGIPPAKELVNHASKPATVEVLVTVTGKGPFTSTDTVEIGANSKKFLGCSGSVSAGQHTTYGVKKVTWH